MFSVNLIYDARYADRFAPFLELRDLLAELSVQLLDNDPDAKADVCIVQSHLIDDLRQKGDHRVQGPIIVNERTDQETVLASNRRLLQDPNTIGWLKECSLRDPALQNAPTIFDYYHYTLLRHDESKYPAVEPEIKLSANDIAKIHLPFSVPSYSRFAVFRSQPSPEPKERDIDAFMYGRLVREHEILTDHRRAGFRAMGRLNVDTSLVSAGYILHYESEIAKFLFRSKIAVSQYGFALCSWKDWDALYAGCVLIKPDGSMQVNYLPDIFKGNEFYVPCRADFADLEEKVEMVMDNYQHFFEKAQMARAAFFESLDLQRRASDFYEILMQCLGRSVLSGVHRYVPTEPEPQAIAAEEPEPEPEPQAIAEEEPEPQAVAPTLHRAAGSAAG